MLQTSTANAALTFTTAAYARKLCTLSSIGNSKTKGRWLAALAAPSVFLQAAAGNSHLQQQH
jgi:hypothetical protein